MATFSTSLRGACQFLVLSILFLASQIAAQDECPTPVAASVASPSLYPGLVAKVVATGLQRPRSIIFDKAGHLLVLEANKGVTALTLQDDGGSCLSVVNSTAVIRQAGLNHGLTLGPAGLALYTSTADKVFLYTYRPALAKVAGTPRTLVSGMDNPDHSTRTILLSKKNPSTIVVNRGSGANVDQQALNVTTGHAQVKAFDVGALAKNSTYDFTSNGTLMAWGVRNSVGLGEEPTSGRIYTVENSVDQAQRLGVDVHQNNPGEEMNFLGYVNGQSSPNTGKNFGYPRCFAVWDPSELPKNASLEIGSQFAIQGSGVSDQFCRRNTVSPRITFQAHSAPIDIKWNTDGSFAFVTFKGSWNRAIPTGYKIVGLPFANGEPVAPANSGNSYTDLISNPDVTQCYSTTCFRPTGMTFDSQGRLFFSSDATGEIWAVTRSDGQPMNGPSILTSVS